MNHLNESEHQHDVAFRVLLMSDTLQMLSHGHEPGEQSFGVAQFLCTIIGDNDVIPSATPGRVLFQAKSDRSTSAR